MVLFNTQGSELGKFSKGGNRSGELVLGQFSACNGRLVCVASDGESLREKVGFLVVHCFYYMLVLASVILSKECIGLSLAASATCPCISGLGR